MALLKTYSIQNDVALQVVNQKKLHKEIQNSNDIDGLETILVDGDTIELYGNSFINEAAVDGSINTHEAVDLAAYKQLKFKEIDARSEELIKEGGFTYNGKQFSLSEAAQINLLGIELKKNFAGILPITFNTYDDLDVETLTTVTHIENFFLAALTAKRTVLDTATLVLKDPIRAATTKAEVDAVIDNR